MEKGKAIQVAEPLDGITSRPMLGIPAFSGQDAYVWVSRVDQYYHANPSMTEQDKLQAVIDALQGTAARWFDHYWKVYTATPLTWPSIKNAILCRFQPEAVNNPLLVLLNIRQTGTLAEYRDLFETLTHSEPLQSPSPHLTLGDEISRAIFLNGLSKDLKVQLRLREVKSLSDLICMAKLIEDGGWAKEEIGSAGPKLMRFWGEIEGRSVVIRVASGDSDSRMARSAVKKLGLVVHECDEVFAFDDGPPVKSEGVCRGVSVKLHEDLVTSNDFFVFENLGGNEDIVLGLNWIRGLERVDVNFRNLKMKIVMGGAHFTIKGNPSLTLPDQCRTPRMSRLNIHK